MALNRNEKTMPQTESSASVPALRELIHFPPAFNIHGQEIPVLQRFRNKTSVSEASLLEPRENWTNKAKVRSSGADSERRKDTLQFQLKVRSIEELRGSKQVADLVSGAFMRKGERSTKLRSKILSERKAQNLESLRTAAKATEQRHKSLLAGSSSVQSCDHSLEAAFHPSVKLSESERVARGRGMDKGKTHHEHSSDRKLEIIRDRPPIPSLAWREEPRTRGDVMQDRLCQSLEAMQAYRRTIAFPALPKKSLDLSHCNSTPTLGPVEVERGPNPFKHMELTNIPKHRKVLETGSKTRRELLAKRVSIFTKEANDTALSAAAFNEAEFQSKIKNITASKDFWWRNHLSAGQLKQIDDKASKIALSRLEKEVLAMCPVEGSKEKHLKEALKLRNDKKCIAGNISTSPAPDLSHEKTEAITKQSFTNVVLEFEKAGVVPEAVEHDDPGDHAPMYSSFAPDNIFLEIEDRRELERVRQENMFRKRRSKRIPKRTFKLSPRTSAQMEQSKGVSRNGFVTGNYTSEAPKGVRLLTSHNGAEEDTGVRTGGFQLINTVR